MHEQYREDLAHVHEAGFARFAAGAASVIAGDLRERGVTSGTVLDLGCGGGTLSAAVAAAGFDASGVDLSPAFVAMAKARVPGGTFRVGSVLDAELPACVAAAAVGEVVNYLFDPAHSWEAVAGLFRRVYAALTPGGMFLVDAAGPGRVAGGASKSFAEGDGWAVLFAADEREGVLTRRMTTFRRVGEWYRRDAETHQQLLIDPAAMVAMLESAGFAVGLLGGYGEAKFPPGWVGFLARRL